VTRRVVLDAQGVTVLADPHHARHSEVRALLQAARDKRRKSVTKDGYPTLVPTSVRVEAGWDRSAPAWSAMNSLRAEDVALDSNIANRAAALRTAVDSGGDASPASRRKRMLSTADAHLGAILHDGDIVATSDPGDIEAMASHRNISVTTVVL